MKKTYNLSNGTIVNVSATNREESYALLNDRHYAYQIIFEVDNKVASFTYHDSVYNFLKGQTATEKMIDGAVDCILSDAYAYKNAKDVHDFISEFGYEDYEKGFKVYCACGETLIKLQWVLSESEIEELNDIIYGLVN